MLALISIYKIKERKMEEALDVSRELVQHGRDSDLYPGLLDMFAYTVKGRKYKNEIVFVENYTDRDALNRALAKAQDLAAIRKLGQLFETADTLRCSSIE